MKVISFEIKGDLAHFRRPYTNLSRLTYKVPPRMTIAGLLSGIIGLERDSYYNIFDEKSFSVSVEPLTELQTVRIPQNVVGTADEDMEKFNSRGGGPTLRVLSPLSYKQRAIEYISHPRYRIFFTLDNSEIQSEIFETLKENRFSYTPKLGTARCLASIRNVQEVTCNRINNKCTVYSPVTDVESIVDVGGKTVATEKITSAFKLSEGSRGTTQRKPTGFLQYAFETNGDGLTVEPSETQEIIELSELGTCVELY